MGFLSQLANVFTGSESAKAARRAGDIQQQEAQTQAANVGVAGQSAIARFDPLSGAVQQGIDQAGFLTDPNQQFQFAQQNPLFNLGVQNLTENVQQSAAGRSRLSAGDTLQRLSTVPLEVAQPLIQSQKQDIMNLLGIGQNVFGSQANIETRTAQDVANLLTGGAAAQAAGVIGAQNARTNAMGNTVDLAVAAATAGAGGPPGGGVVPPPVGGQLASTGDIFSALGG
jgi:hypothetical protein